MFSKSISLSWSDVLPVPLWIIVWNIFYKFTDRLSVSSVQVGTKKNKQPQNMRTLYSNISSVCLWWKWASRSFYWAQFPPQKKSSSPWPLSRSACWELPAEWAESAGQMLRVDSSNCLKNGASICLKSGLVSSGWLRLAGSDTGRLCAVTEENTVSGCPASASVEPREEEKNRPHGEIEEVWEGMRGR